jgi:hypothetical protein
LSLDVGKDHLGVDSAVRDHGVHVVSCQEIGNAGVTPEKKFGHLWMKFGQLFMKIWSFLMEFGQLLVKNLSTF